MPAELQLPTAADEDLQPGEELVEDADVAQAGRRRDPAVRVWAALGTVLDPEIDEPITDLDFVESCTVSDDGAAIVSACGCRRSSARRTSRS